MSRSYINVTDPGYDDYPEEQEPDLSDFEYQEMYLQVGFFIAEYSTVELGITGLLALLSQFKDPHAFHVLTMGMDAKVKVRRLRQLAGPKNLIAPKGKLAVRLSYFYDHVADLRNKVAHGWLVKSKDDPQRIFFANIASMPFDTEDGSAPDPLGRSKPEEILVEILLEYSLWLSDFHKDLVTLIEPARQGKKLLLKNPKSMEPQQFREHLLKQETLARERTRHQEPLP